MEFCEGGRIDDLEFIESSGISKSEVSNFEHEGQIRGEGRSGSALQMI